MGVFNLEKLALLVSSRMGPLLVEHQRCSKVRSPLSKCSHCIDVCPVDALSFGHDGIEINEDCLECGLCAASCPTGALGIQEPTEIALLEKILHLGERGGTGVIGCRPQHELNPKGILTPCLGSLSWELLLTLDTLSFPVYIVQSMEKCADCPVIGGGEQFLKQLKTARQLLDTLKMSKGSIKVLPEAPIIKAPKKTADADPGRRAFFRSVFTGAKQMPVNMLQAVLAEPKEEERGIKEAKGIDTGRLYLLKKTLGAEPSQIDEFEMLQQVELVSTCYFCRACSILCPLGAIKQTKENQLVLDTGKCTGCNLCTEVCLHHSLALKPVNLTQVCQGETKIIAQGVAANCQKCGQKMISSETKEICFVCERKAQWQAV